MAKYIDAEAVIEAIRTNRHTVIEDDYEHETDYIMWAIGFNAGLDRAIHDIACAPAADVEPVKRGAWEKEDTGRGPYLRCSVCHFDGLGAGSQYCPHCGSHMDEEVDQP